VMAQYGGWPAPFHEVKSQAGTSSSYHLFVKLYTRPPILGGRFDPFFGSVFSITSFTVALCRSDVVHSPEPETSRTLCASSNGLTAS
jgi:hypothetical protein